MGTICDCIKEEDLVGRPEVLISDEKRSVKHIEEKSSEELSPSSPTLKQRSTLVEKQPPATQIPK